MQSLKSHIHLWDIFAYVVPKLRISDLRKMRFVCRNLKLVIDEQNMTHYKLRKYVSKTNQERDKLKSVRYLLRNLYVPQVCRQTILPERRDLLIRPPYPAPSQWVISVMTMVSYLSTPVDLRSVFHCVDVVDFDDMGSEQRQDLCHARKEASCGRPLQKKKFGIFGPANECIDEGCECLSGFFPGILDIHYQNFCRGDPEFAEVKAKKRGRNPLRTFENQCTMRICMSRTIEGCHQKNGQTWNIVNLKIFQNGKIQMTGCKSLEQARGAVQFLLRKLMEKAPAMRAKRDCMTQLRCFCIDQLDLDTPSSSNILKSIHVSHQHHPIDIQQSIPKDALMCVLLHVDNESLYACRRVNVLFRNLVESPDFWRIKSEREIRCICDRSDRGWFLTHKYNGRFHRMERVKNAEHFSHPRLLYCRYSSRALRRHRPFLVAEKYEDLHVAGEQVGMINSDFRTNFDINLPVLFKILFQEHRKQSSAQLNTGKILQCSYSPDDYVALNVKYESPIIPDPIPDEEPTGAKTIISFFIFRTGSVIINSARSIAQEIEAYEFINALFKTHYARIWNVETSKPKKRKK